MSPLSKASLKGELIPPASMVSVFGTTHPLNAVAGAQIHCRVPAGWSVMEILLEALRERPGWQLRRDLIVTLSNRRGGEEIVIEEGNWSKVRVKPGTVLTFRPRLQGGGGALRSALGLAVAVAAIVVAGPLGGAFAASAFGTAIGISASVATSLIAGGIILAGTMALNALFPVRPPAAPDSVNSAALNSIQGAQNQASPFGSIPVVLGTHRQSPVYAAKPYTEIVGDDQYLRLLFCLGYGPLSIADIKIGETPLSSFSGWTIETRQGFVDDAPVTLYPGVVDEVALSIQLENVIDPTETDGSGGYWQTQTTSPDSDEISLDFTATEGIYKINSAGSPDYYRVSINSQYRAVGAGSWIDLPVTSFGRSTSPARRGVTWSVTRGQYEVRVQKATGNGDPAKIKDTIVWSAIRSIKRADPITFPEPLSIIALRIKATDQLSGVVNTLNCICTSLVKAWNGSSWVANTASAWPSDLFRHVLQGPANARPVPDSQIDLENLQDWWTYCVAKGFKFNQVRSSVTSVSDTLDDIAAAGRAVKTFIDGKWGVIWDRPSDPIVQHFTPRNSWGFQGQRSYAQQPHGWRVSFINADNGYTQDERIVYDDGYTSANATLFEGLQFPGVTDPDLIWKHGRFHIAQNRLRPEKISLSVGWEHLVCTRGDRVRVTHDVLLTGLASGRIKSVAGQVVTFDEMVTIEDGNTYGMQFRVPSDARTIDRAVDVTPAGEYDNLTLVGDLTGLAVGNLFAFGETDRESADYRVQGISPQKDLVATLTLVDDAPEISTADSGTIPAYDPHVTIPADPFTLPPRNLRYLEVIDGAGSAARAMVLLSWQVPRFGGIKAFEVQIRDDDAGGAWTAADSVVPPRTSVAVALIASGVWSFRVRCVFDNGTVSDWASLIGLNLAGLTFAPDNITNLHFRIVDGQTVLDWTVVADQRLLAYEVRKGSSWDTGLVVGPSVAEPPWPTTGDGTYHVRAYVLSPFGVRIYSVATASITIAGSIIARNIVLSKDEQVSGWTGGLDGGVIDGDFIRTDSGLSLSAPFAIEVVEQLEIEGLHIAVYVSDTVVDVGRPAECRFWTEFDAAGVLQSADFLASDDLLATDDILGASPTRFIRAFPIWRFADTGEADVFAEPDVFAPADVFTADIAFGDWVAVPSGTRVSRYFEAGYVLITDQEITNATGTKFKWFVDVPDRVDHYTDLSVPDTGLSVTFFAGGYSEMPTPGATATPFNGGPGGSLVPHVQTAIVDGTNGDEVKITDLTVAGCTVHVVNAGSNVTRPGGINILVLGY